MSYVAYMFHDLVPRTWALGFQAWMTVPLAVSAVLPFSTVEISYRTLASGQVMFFV